jgi:hypothetical protein
MNESLTVILSLIGVILGFLLSEFSTHRKEKKQMESVRYLFKMEVNSNLELLNNFINKIKEDYKTDPSNYTLELIELPWPRFKSVIWGNQNIFLTSAFDDKNVKNIQEFYNSLDSLESIYSHIKTEINQNHLKPLTPYKPFISHGVYYEPYNYSGEYNDFAKEFIELAEKLINNGNPLDK